MLSQQGLGNLIGEVARRPHFAAEAVRAFFAMRRRGRPFPSKAYLEWRAHTAYGVHKAGIDEDDLFHYLAWRKRLRESARRGRVA